MNKMDFSSRAQSAKNSEFDINISKVLVQSLKLLFQIEWFSLSSLWAWPELTAVYNKTLSLSVLSNETDF